jgi:hypothetical protein
MTYKEQFVAEVKVNGKILRVKDGAVYLPFGSEYSILLKNLNSKKASVKISIDGEDVLDGSSLILDPNVSTELEGFLNETIAKNRFKFIHKTEKIQEHRGDRADDGMIRIEFAYEKDKPEPLIKKSIEEVHYYYHNPIKYDYYPCNNWTYIDDMTSERRLTGSSGSGVKNVGDNSCEPVMCSSNVTMDSLGVQNMSSPLPEEGITVKGNEIHQQFQYGSIGALDKSEVIVIRLKGLTQTQNTVQNPITVKTKLTCSSCGTKSKSSFKFCPECGTYLE